MPQGCQADQGPVANGNKTTFSLGLKALGKKHPNQDGTIKVRVTPRFKNRVSPPTPSYQEASSSADGV